MNLSEKEIQELKNKKISIEDLNDRHFIDSQNKVETENILKLLNENICDFKYIVERFYKPSQMIDLLKNEELFDEIIENGALTEDVARFIFDRSFQNDILQVFSENLSLVSYSIGSNVISFYELVDAYCSKYIDQYSDALYDLLENKKLFESLVKNNKLSKEDLRYLLSKIDDEYELGSLNANTFLSYHIISESIVSFQFLIETYKKIECEDDERCLYKMFHNKKLFERLLESDILNTDDLKDLLSEVSDHLELNTLIKNTPIIKWFLGNFLLEKNSMNKTFIDKFNKILEEPVNPLHSWIKEENVRTVFDLIEHHFADEQVLKLNTLIRFVYESELNETQRLELTEVLKANESAQNKLFQILKNNLEDTYDFETLKELLTKDNERKKKIKMNF